MSYLPILVRAIDGRRPGSPITIDTLRVELVAAAQIPAAALGSTFAEACQKGYLWSDGRTVASKWPPAKGRRILIYHVGDGVPLPLTVGRERCQWCGRFVAEGTAPTRWETLHNGSWRRHERLLCPACHQSASRETPGWRPL